MRQRSRAGKHANVSSPSAVGAIGYRDLTMLQEFAAVVELERQIWGPGYDDVVPAPIFAVSVKRGGILIGAFDGARLVGFVYSLPGLKDGKPTQWSHMLGVVDGHRRGGLGCKLKVLQRERALAMGLDLIEWTFDPMQAVNAHFSIGKLGAIADEYDENVYGASSSPLHKGNPTDRLVAQWEIRQERVERRISGGAALPSVLTVEPANRMRPRGEWFEPVEIDVSLDRPRISVQIPTGFTGMLSRAPDLAMTWRLATRQIFTTYFARGYRAVGFFLDSHAGGGTYLLAR
jgi:predicted GNAT superfamily acetyltransferase